MFNAQQPVAVLQTELTHRDPHHRCEAIRKIAQSGKTYVGLTATIIRLVADRDEETRAWACEALESLVVPEPSDLAELTQLLRETNDGDIEYWSATMIGRLGSAAGPATGALANCLLDSACLAARERAAWALSEIGPPARGAVNALLQIGPDDPPRLQRLAASAIQAVARRAA